MTPKPSNTRYGMVNRIVTKPGQRDVVVDILLAGAKMQGGMRGCEIYVVHTSTTDPNEVWVTEVWRSKADHEASLQNAEVRALIEKGRPMIASIVPTITNAVGGKGISA
jgi:quinol monooxygenase YgiN